MFNANHKDRVAAALKGKDVLPSDMVSTLTNALVIAKEKLEENRKYMAEQVAKLDDPEFIKAHEGGMVSPSIYAPMERQFAGQVKEVQALLDWLEGPEEGEVDGQEITDIEITRTIRV